MAAVQCPRGERGKKSPHGETLVENLQPMTLAPIGNSGLSRMAGCPIKHWERPSSPSCPAGSEPSRWFVPAS